MNDAPIYLDHAATTPVDPEVVAAMIPFLSDPLSFGNPSSIHQYGRVARGAVDEARDLVARLVGADYSEVYFTGSGTEANNLALTGVMLAGPESRRGLITSSIEHHAILHTAHFLKSFNVDVTVVPADRDGIVDPDDVAGAVSSRTMLVSLMHANNEIGSIQPIAEVAAIAQAEGALCHTDAIQTAGMLDIDFRTLGCDMMSLSAHKIYGPKGVGALVIKQGTRVSPILYGGAQEREKRAGTENVAGIVGFGKAAQIATERRLTDAARLAEMRDRFIARLQNDIPGLRLNGAPLPRLANNVNVSVEGLEGPTLLMSLDRRCVAASSGSACSSGSIEPSHVLKAIGLSDAEASGGIRFTLGRGTSDVELERAAEIFASIVRRLRSGRPSPGGG